MRLRLAELIAALSLATDLGLGLPQEHVLRQCRIALGLAERVGVDDAERAAVYYVAMLAWVGCTADSYELAAQFGDEIAFRADAHRTDLAGRPLMEFMLRRVGDGQGPLRRVQMAATLVANGGRGATEAMKAHCRVAAAIASRLGLGPEVQQPLLHVFARWDGKGMPSGVRGEELPLAIRLVHIAGIAEVFHRTDGVDRRDHRQPRARRRSVRPAAGGGLRRLRAGAPRRAGGGVELGRRDLGRAGPGRARSPATSSTPRSRRSPTSPTSSRPGSAVTRAASRGWRRAPRSMPGCPSRPSRSCGGQGSCTTSGAPGSRTRSGTSRAR